MLRSLQAELPPQRYADERVDPQGLALGACTTSTGPSVAREGLGHMSASPETGQQGATRCD
ncbi:hypothetical protein AAW51_4836 [Caldimonas brevitalea]|uniref:Uncharacterized protein n=1 Tax=Caldimonas brevitalea TaxID=413882 RepID=A0A0G3BQ30_9BURK|nr:hypothetical protein AAW51_4836 [Caldimonas brevitalea]